MSGATFLTLPGADLEMMKKYGLGGVAVVGDLVFAGAMAIDLKTLKRPESAVTVADETRQCFDGIAQRLELAGCGLGDIRKITSYVSGDEHRAGTLAALKDVFAPGPVPKNITLGVGIAGDCRVEFEVVALKPRADAGATGARRSIRENAALGVAAGSATDMFVYASGLAIDPSTMKRVPEADTIAGELRVVLSRIEATLAEEGLTLKDLAKVTAWVSDEEHRLDFAYAYADQLAPGPYPSRALFRIGLAGDCRVQIDAIAARRDVTSGGGELVFADALGTDPAACLAELKARLEAQGCAFKDIVKVNSYLVDDNDRAAFWKTYNETLAPGPYAPRLTQVCELEGDARVLLDVVAVRPG